MQNEETSAITTQGPPPRADSSDLDAVDERELAAEVGCDVRTVQKVLRGQKVRGLVEVRIRRAIEARLRDRGLKRSNRAA